MASPIRHRVEPLLGWLFLAWVAAALVLTFLSATQPMDDDTGRFPVEQID